MDFDRLPLAIIIIIFWLISNTIRKLTQPTPKGPASADQKSGLFKMLQQHLAALEEKGEKAVINLDAHFQPAAQPRALIAPSQKSLIDMAEGSRPQDSVETTRKTFASPPPVIIVKPKPALLPRKPGMTGTNRHKLQNAVIWAEILAPPVAMRER
jgi:hypothetical protein